MQGHLVDPKGKGENEFWNEGIMQQRYHAFYLIKPIKLKSLPEAQGPHEVQEIPDEDEKHRRLMRLYVISQMSTRK